MVKFRLAIIRLGKFMDIIAGVSITFVMLLTFCDVVLRYFGAPITGTYELVSLGGAMAIGLSSPFTFLKKAHITVDTIVEKSPHMMRKILNISTRAAAIVIVAMIGWNSIIMGFDMLRTRQVTPTLYMPFYPVSWALGVSFFVVCLVLLHQMIEIICGGENE